jgi:hypothetical protein
VASTVLQSGARLLQALSADRAASHSLHSTSAKICNNSRDTIRGFAKLHVITTIMGQLLIFILKYLMGILLLVHDILQISF